MNRIAAIIVVIGMTFASLLPACGQQISTVGDVVDKGGKKLTKEEVRKLFSGATVSGFQGGNFPNTRFRNQISPNGSVSGDAWHGDVWFTKISGTWSVNDAGQFCNDLRNDQGGKITGCSFYYSIGDRFYAAAGADRSIPVNARQFGR
jgi:hypothetical protein